jgi:hypothetical protein
VPRPNSFGSARLADLRTTAPQSAQPHRIIG